MVGKTFRKTRQTDLTAEKVFNLPSVRSLSLGNKTNLRAPFQRTFKIKG